MCSQFEQPIRARKKRVRKEKPEDLFDLSETQIIFPAQKAIALFDDTDFRDVTFGLDVEWSKSPVFNCRYETMDQKHTFNGMKNQRCLVPAVAYFEWRTDNRGTKHKNTISEQSGDILWMAGILKGKSCVILTKSAQKGIDHIHGRMPIFVEEDHFDKWWQTDLQPDWFATHARPGLNADEQRKENPQMDLF